MSADTRKITLLILYMVLLRMERSRKLLPYRRGFIGEGGTFLNPEAVRTNKPGKTAGTKIQGKEAVGGLRFSRKNAEAKRSSMATFC